MEKKTKWQKITRNQFAKQVILICYDGQIIEFVKSERYFKITDDMYSTALTLNDNDRG